MPDQKPFVTITHHEVWEEIRHHAMTTGDGGHADHEVRIRRLELKYYALLAGIVTGTVTAASIIIRG